MRAHVLLNLLIELWKREAVRLTEHLSLFPNKFK